MFSRSDDIEILASYYRNELSKSKISQIEARKRTDYEFRKLAEEVRDIVVERPQPEADNILEAMKIVQPNSSSYKSDEETQFVNEIDTILSEERSRRRKRNNLLIIILLGIVILTILMALFLG